MRVNAESGPAFWIRDSRELELDGVSTRKTSESAPVLRLDRCPGAVVRNCTAFPGTGTFLSVAPGELKRVVLEGNALGNARRKAEESRASDPVYEPATEE